MKQLQFAPLWILLSLILVVPTQAQRLCETIVADALETARENCQNLGDNNVCYGYDSLTSTFYDNTLNNTLRQQGDIAPHAPISIIDGTVFDAENDEWSLGYIQIGSEQLPDGEALRLILLGDVTLENYVEPEQDSEYEAFQLLGLITGVESDCPEAVNNLLIQSPKGLETELVINDIPVAFGSTLVLGWATEDNELIMYITVLDGYAVTDYDTDGEQFISLREFSIIRGIAEEEITDPVTGETLLDNNGRPLIRRFVDETTLSTPEPLTEDGEGFQSLGYYKTFEQIPEELLNYAISLEAEEEPCDCEEDESE